MVLPESAFREPYFIRYREGATLVRSDKRRFDYMNVAYASYPREYRTMPRPGYNAQSPRIKPDRVNLSTDAPTIRAK